MNSGENGGVRAHAESDREHDNGGESGILQEHARAIAKILRKCIEQGKTPPLAVFLLGLLETPELDECIAPRFCRAHARAQIVFDVHLEMAFHLRRKIAFSPLFAEKSAESQ